MCEHCKHKEQPGQKFEKPFHLATYFNGNWEKYLQSPTEFIHPEQFKAVNAIMTCRTPALGVDIYTCPGCGEVTEVYHSCKNRFCPTCSWSDTMKWADKVKGQMLNLPHRHVVFTLPHALHPLIKSNGKHLLNNLMRTSADTLKDWISHKYRLNIGIITVLHTFGEKKNLHYHVHMIVSWRGIDPSTGELRAIQGDYVNYGFLQDKFRCKFEDSLVELYDSGQLENKFEDRVDLLRFLKKINEKNWALHLEPPMEIPTEVIRYIGRYSKRACLSEYKITAMAGEYISFRYKEYKELDKDNKPIEKELTLHYSDFFPRLLQHVPLPYFRLVRYYGLYSNRGSIPEEYLYKDPSTEEVKPDEYEEYQPLYCRHCRREKVYHHTVIEKRKKNNMENRTIIVYRRPDIRFRRVA